MSIRYFALLSVVILSSCKSQKPAHNTKNGNGIFGTWSYAQSSGGFTGKGTGWEKPVTLVLSPDQTWQLKRHDKMLETDRFKLTSALRGEDSVKVIDLDTGIDKGYKISGDSLFLDELVNDGYSYLYLRQR